MPSVTVTSTAANTGWPAIGRISTTYTSTPVSALASAASGSDTAGAPGKAAASANRKYPPSVSRSPCARFSTREAR